MHGAGARGPGALAIAVALALVALLYLPALRLGFVLDDYLIVDSLAGRWPPGTPPWTFAYSSGDPAELLPWTRLGFFAWWVLPTIRIAFLRPLALASAQLDVAIFGTHAAGHHLQSLLWYVALVLAFAALLRRILPGAPRTAALALLVYAVDEAHAMDVWWLASRNATIATACGVAGLALHVRWRAERWWPGLPLSLAALALGLAGGETALGVFAYVAAYQLVEEGPWRRRLAGLAPAAALAVGWGIVYAATRHGTSGSGLYIDPVHDPGAYFSGALPKLAALLGTAIAGAPSDLWVLGAKTRWPLVAVGVVATPLLALALRRVFPSLPAPTRRALRWMIPGALLSLAPAVASMPQDRLLLCATLGGSVVVAALIDAAIANVRGPASLARDRVVVAAGAAMAFVHLVIAPIALEAHLRVIHRLAERMRAMALTAEIDDARAPDEDVLVLSADYSAACYVVAIRTFAGHPMPRAWWVLSIAPHDLVYRRVAPDRLELEVEGGRLLATELERLFRGPSHPLRTGDVATTGAFSVHILDGDERGVRRVEFHFARPPDDPSWRALAWDGERLARVAIPPVGGTLRVPYRPGPTSSP